MKLTKSQKLYWCCLAFIIGLALGYIGASSLQYILLSLATITALLALSRHPIALVSLFIIIGCGYHLLFNTLTQWQSLAQLVDSSIGGNFLVVESRTSDDKQIIVASTRSVADKKYRGRIQLYTKLYPEYHYGDLITVKGKLLTIDNPDNRSYQHYLEKSGIVATMYEPFIARQAHGHGNPLYQKLISLRDYSLQQINKFLPEPESSLLSGLLLGYRANFSERMKQALSETGTTHIIAISGYNISLIANCLSNIFVSLRVNRKKAFKYIVTLIFIFVIFTGASASVVRAAIMGSLALLAKHWGRLSKIGNIIILTIVTMLIINPKILLYDLGFQLSVLSTVGLIYFSPLIEKYFLKLPEKFGLRDNITATLSATALTAPLIIYNFGRQSIISLPVNLLVLPAIPIAMLLGFVMLILGAVSSTITQPFGYIAYLPLKYIMLIINHAATIPLASINLKVSFSVMLAAYIFLIIKIKNPSKFFERLKSNEQTSDNHGCEPNHQK